MSIFFYSKSADYFWLSNFSPHGFELDGKHWPTVEHYFQAAKFFGTDDDWAEQIRRAATPAKAKSLGRSRKHPIRSDWEQAKDDVMRIAVRRKFETHAGLRELLPATDDSPTRGVVTLAAPPARPSDSPEGLPKSRGG